MPPNINDPSPFRFPKLGCGRFLKLNLAKTGVQKGRNYCCDYDNNFNDKKWWYRTCPETTCSPVCCKICLKLTHQIGPCSASSSISISSGTDAIYSSNISLVLNTIYTIVLK
ncbi:hypothetical protein MVEN_02306500 [Mycena venus]|uniref:Uncharacterized protein n=1 Tax=Mycena venus TaxID=2733690 RepID=A0A8H6X455_9AGAR|nr:hypothetical protein MVEN_02306500 [Mycena venus]